MSFPFVWLLLCVYLLLSLLAPAVTAASLHAFYILPITIRPLLSRLGLILANIDR